MSEDAHRPNISPKVRAAIAKPLKFYFPVPSIDLTKRATRSSRWGSCSARRRRRGPLPTH
jgi:hypothetical protein